MEITISQRLRQLRKSNALTLKEVSREISVPISTYRDWECGTPIKGEPYIKLAALFNVSLIFLLTGEETERREEEFLNQIKSIHFKMAQLSQEAELIFSDS